ncbi:mediator-associated protein 1-like, partial [Trifolium medium]|nr:mediator-associated protein 1-like [Trifolium medium]
DFKSQTGNDPDKDFKAFHESLKDSLSIKTTVRKLREKVRVLKLKFEKNCQNNEKDLTFSSSYEKEAFELSQKYWGQEKRVEEKEKPPKKKNVAKKPAKEESAKGESSDKMGHIGLSESFDFDEMCMGVNVLKRGMELLGEAKREELETRWKKLKAREMEVLVMRAELVKDHARLILNELEG